ncbi:MAG: DJ-1/PfpI family protein [Saprospiraceae bacterium]|nr:DJ-1/PfpI family protein [Lewinella sp.]
MKKLLFAFLCVLLLLPLKAQRTADIQNVALFLQDRVEILDFAGPMEVLIAAGFNVYIVARTKAPIKAMGELTILPDYSIEDCPTPDLIAFFGGGGAARVAQYPDVQKWLAEVFPKTKMQFSVCTGAFFLGEMGLLDGKTATTFHSAIPGLQERFPEATVRDDVRYVDNGSVITTAGISAGIDGALHLVAKLKGKDRAKAVAENMEYFGWEPEKGLIMETPVVQTIKKQGFRKAMQSAGEESTLYYGEMMDMGKALAAEGHPEKAMEVFDYALEVYQLAPNDCEVVRDVYLNAGRKVPPSREKVLQLVNEGDFTAAADIIETTKKDFPNWSFFTEHNGNMHGYHYLGNGDIKKAIGVFKLNVLAYPDSFNTYDSLGEAYMAAEEWDLAVQNYRKSVDLNPDNENGRQMLKKIEELRTKKKRMEQP